MSELPLTLSGEELVQRLYLSQAAVENWARLANGPRMLYSARFALLDLVREHGQLSTQPPSWMTTPRPDVLGYVFLPGDLVLLLTGADQEAVHGRPYLASNCVACRRRAGGRPEPVSLESPRLEGEALARALAMSGPELAEHTRLTQHCLQRYAERMERQPDQAQPELLELIAESGQAHASSPAWADASGRGQAVILLHTGQDELALPIVPDFDLQSPHLLYAATTCLPRSWVDEDLAGREGLPLAERIHVGSAAAEQYRAEDLEAGRQELEERIAHEGTVCFEPPPEAEGNGPFLMLSDGWLRLRPASEAFRASAGKPWLAVSWHAREEA